MKKFNTTEEREAFDLGATYVKQYIGFCIANYVLKMNLGGLSRFFHDLCRFAQGVSHIPNTRNNMTFEEFCKIYDVEK